MSTASPLQPISALPHFDRDPETASLPPERTSSSPVPPSQPISSTRPSSPALGGPSPAATGLAGTSLHHPLPPSRAIPQDFRSSLSAWWSNSSYRDARQAEERLLRRLSGFEPPKHEPAKGWFNWGSSSGAGSTSNGLPSSDKAAAVGNANGTSTEAPNPTAKTMAPTSSTSSVEQILDRVKGKDGLVATLKNVFIPTPDPFLAPQHPADPMPALTTQEDGSVSSHGTGKRSKSSHNPLHAKHHHYYGDEKAKMVDYINTLEISDPQDKNSKEAVVVLHGYAAALGFFFRNWSSIAQSGSQTHRRTFFLDWLGMGLSSRPSPHLLASPSSAPVPARVARAEHFFISSLEAWRAEMGIERMVLVGHSLGGYLSAAYTVRYPERVSGLVLVSPAGVPKGPTYKKWPTTDEAERQERAKKEARDQAVDAAEREMEMTPEEKERAGSPKGEAEKWKRGGDQASFLRRNTMKFFVWGWERGWSPFTILRSVGPWGPMMVGNYSRRRFASQAEEDVRDLHSYIYGTSVMKGSGEFCISHILEPGAYARIPIVDRIGKVKVPVTFLYGDNDWMDVDGGRASKTVLEKAGNLDASVHVVEKAGHHVYLDNPEQTNKIIGDAIRAIPLSMPSTRSPSPAPAHQ